MIPEEKQAIVAHALEQTFGTPEFTDIQRMTRGLSSDLVFRIVVRGTPYLLRVMTRSDEQMDPIRIFACMGAASIAGLTPCVRYSDTEQGISISDFIEAVPLPETEALVQLPSTLRRLHALPLFPKAFNYVTAHRFFIWRFRKAGLLPEDEIEEVFTRYEQVCATYPRVDADMVSSHMDSKPENILFDGRRVWLVDWQAAFVNDRYFDLAVVANFLLVTEEDELSYLERYFGQPASDYQSARFFLMRQMLHIFYATVFLLLGSPEKPIDQNEKLPTFVDFHRRIWAGEINFAENAPKSIYGRVHWMRLLENMRQTRFNQALQIVADRNSLTGETARLLPLPE